MRFLDLFWYYVGPDLRHWDAEHIPIAFRDWKVGLPHPFPTLHTAHAVVFLFLGVRCWHDVLCG